MAEIKIRFNTKWEEAPSPDLKWRILVDGVEYLASQVAIHVRSETSQDVIEGGIMKWHLSCHGDLRWNGTRAQVE